MSVLVGLENYIKYFNFNKNYNVNEIILLILHCIIIYIILMYFIFICKKDIKNIDKNIQKNLDKWEFLTLFMWVILMCSVPTLFSIFISFITSSKNQFSKYYNITIMKITDIKYFNNNLFLVTFDLFNYFNNNIIYENYEIIFNIINLDYNFNILVINYILFMLINLFMLIYYFCLSEQIKKDEY